MRDLVRLIGHVSAVLFVAGLVGAAAPAQAAAVTQPAMLRAMATNCLGPRLSMLRTRADQLFQAAQALHQAPTSEALERTQQAWKELRLAYQRSRMLIYGPVKDLSFWTAAFYRQPMETAVHNVVQSTRTIDAEFIELLGSSAKGLYVLEFLLFDLHPGPAVKVGSAEPGQPRISVAALLEGPSSARRRLYVLELTRDLARLLGEADAESAGLGARFANGGQESVDFLVNQLVVAVEAGLRLPLKSGLDQWAAGTLRYEQIEGVASGTTMSGLRAAFEGAHSFYLGENGLGLDDYVRNVEPRLADRFAAQFATVGKLLEAIELPLDQAFVARKSELVKLSDEVRKLELLCKVDLVATFGVTIMFSGNDGD